MKVNVLTGIRSGGSYNWGRDLASELCENNTQAKHIHSLAALLSSPLRQDADIAHTSLPLSYHLWKKPVILTVHGEYAQEKNIWRFFYPAAIRKAAVITTPSNFLKERTRLKNAIIIPNAVHPQRYGIAKHSDKDILNITTVTSFYFPEKARGVTDIIDILGKLPEKARSRIKYTVVGGGPYLKQIASENARPGLNVEFTGNMPEPAKILENSDIFLYYSHHDNFPIVILEAMACGLPVLTNNVGAVDEIIKNEQDGYIAKTKKSYTEGLSALLGSHTLRGSMGEQARISLEAKFDWANIVKEYIKLYERLI